MFFFLLFVGAVHALVFEWPVLITQGNFSVDNHGSVCSVSSLHNTHVAAVPGISDGNGCNVCMNVTNSLHTHHTYVLAVDRMKLNGAANGTAYGLLEISPIAYKELFPNAKEQGQGQGAWSVVGQSLCRSQSYQQ
ncbi:hypothetical protein BDF14DRAFT_21990 [Spinellus fusiger]|nr:hypothetical protein BDF14DRAFT_21990 [Spinellus fusiger]